MVEEFRRVFVLLLRCTAFAQVEHLKALLEVEVCTYYPLCDSSLCGA